MFNGLKRKIAERIIKRKVAKGNQTVREFNNFISNASSFLFLLPEENELLLEALEVVNYFKIHRKHCVVILNEININRPDLAKFEKISYSENDVGKFDLPAKDLQNKLKAKKYDVLIDLTFDKNPFLLALASFANAEFKIAFANPKAELYANLIFPADLKNPEISYRNLLNSLGMF
jgi:hypothetical protein